MTTERPTRVRGTSPPKAETTTVSRTTPDRARTAGRGTPTTTTTRTTPDTVATKVTRVMMATTTARATVARTTETGCTDLGSARTVSPEAPPSSRLRASRAAASPGG